MGFALRRRAAAPAACGAAAEVPKNVAKPGTLVETPSGATTSGFSLPSLVGPRELKNSIEVGVCQFTAPTDRTPSPASNLFGMLPWGTTNSFIGLPFVVMTKRSKTLGEAIPALLIAIPMVACTGPLLMTARFRWDPESLSVGYRNRVRGVARKDYRQGILGRNCSHSLRPQRDHSIPGRQE